MKEVQPGHVNMATTDTGKRSTRLKQCLLPILCMLLMFCSSCKKDLQYTPTTVEDVGTTALRPAAGNGKIGINVLLNTAVSDAILDDLETHGRVIKIFSEINALTMQVERDKLPVVSSLSYVTAASGDAERQASPVDVVSVPDFTGGLSTWNLDAINITQYGVGRIVQEDGTGVFVGVLDTGLPDSWRQYFPQERIAVQYAKTFGGGGGEVGTVSEQPNKWEHDQNGHGGHVTSTIIGFQMGSSIVNGVAPKATIIPVRIFNNSGWTWISVITEGILYFANLKAGALSNSPLILNMSFGSDALDAMEQAAMDYAISKGVILVGAAGNSGMQGMGYPGAYAPVLSVAAAGLNAQFSIANWWREFDTPDPTNTNDFYLAGFSSRALAGQDLDITAPGSLVVGPFQRNSGQLSYAYLSGTSMATPHVSGLVALMAQKKPTLTTAEAEIILQSTALPMSAGPTASGSGLVLANAALAAL